MYISGLKNVINYGLSSFVNSIFEEGSELIYDAKEIVENTLVTSVSKVAKMIFPSIAKVDTVYKHPEIIHNESFEKEGNKSSIFNIKDFSYKKLRSNLGIGMINGAFTSIESAKEDLGYLSELAGGYDIKGVYNSTNGILNDMYKCYLGLKYTATPPVRLLHQRWDKFFTKAKNNGFEDAHFLQICHSQGALLTRLALLTYDPEKRKNIFVVAISPLGFIPPDICRKVRHYEVPFLSDPVPYMDPYGKELAKDSIQSLKSHPNASAFDHSFNSPTYKEYLKNHLTWYIESNGKEI